MNDPNTFWLTVTNIALAAIVLVLVVGVMTGVVCEYVARVRGRHATYREIDREMRDMIRGAAPKGRSR